MRNFLIAIISLILVFPSCYNNDDYSIENLNPDEVILSITSDSNDKTILANNAATTIISVKLPVDAEESLSKVSFKTSKGTFIESEKNTAEAVAKLVFDNNIEERIAQVTLKSGLSVGAAIIKVSVLDIEKSDTIQFERNFATSIDIIPAALAMQSNPLGELSIKTKLKSSKGGVSIGQTINLFVQDENGDNKGSYREFNNSSDANGECSFIYSLVPDTTFIGKLIISAQALDGAMPTATKEIYVIE